MKRFEILEHVDPFDLLVKENIQSKRNILITNAYTNIGHLVLKKLLKNPNVHKVTSISTQPLKTLHPKLKDIQCKEFLSLKEFENSFENQDCCFYFPSKEQKENKLKHENLKYFVNLLKEKNENVFFNYLSDKKSRFISNSSFVNESEGFLISLKFKQLNIFRAGIVYQRETKFDNNALKFLFPLLPNFVKDRYFVEEEQLAEFISNIGHLDSPNNHLIFENLNICREK
jgi:hypothetical protein